MANKKILPTQEITLTRSWDDYKLSVSDADFSVSSTSSSVTLKASGNGEGTDQGVINTSYLCQVNLTNYKTLGIEFSGCYVWDWGSIKMIVGSNTSSITKESSILSKEGGVSNSGTATIDVSDLSGNYYVGIRFSLSPYSNNEHNPSGKITISNMYLTENVYSITYKPGSYSTGSTYTASANIGSKITLRGATYTRTGYTQTGWSTSSTGTTKNYNLSTAYSLSDGVVLYPYWESSYVTISYNSNGGTGTTDSQSVIKGNNVTLKANNFTAPPATSPVHTIYLKTENGGNSVNGTATCYENKFHSWGLNSATGTSYQPGSSYGPVNSNTTFYAKWSTNYELGSSTKSSSESWGYQVIFDVATNGGSCSTAVLNSKIYTHYDFAGWLNSDKTKLYPVGARVGGAAAYTYYESWTSRTENGSIKLPAATKTYPASNTTTIYFNANSGICNTSFMTSSATINHSFDGWYNGNTRVGGANDNFTPKQALTLVARFTSTTQPFNKITLPTATKTGYTFLGWSTNPNATSGIMGQYEPQGGETLYAIWRSKGTVRISIDGNMNKKAQVYIFHNGAWHLAQPQTNYNNQWKINGG